MSGLSTKTSHGRKRTNAGIKLIAVAAVLMMVASGLCVMERSNGSVSAANNGAEHSIIYHSNNEAKKTKSVLYNGIAATEYNPEYWNFDEKWTGDKGTYDAKSSKSITLSDKFENDQYDVSSNSTGLTIDSTRWNSSGGISETYTLTVRYSVSGYSANKVFAGWNTAADGTGTSYYPGDVVSSTVTDLYAVWAQPDIFLTSTNTDSKSITFSLVPYYKTSSLPTSAPTKVYSPSPSMYTTIFALTDDVTVSSTTNLIPGTYRSYSVYESSSSKVSITLASRAILSGNAVFDNVYLSENYPGGNHGDGTSCGLFANGHVLILGTGIDSKATSISSLPQVFGGGTSDITTAVVKGKSIVSRNLDTFTADLGTMVIVHSGKYYNIVGGGASSVGRNSTPLSTYIVVKEASVYDTIVGGGSGSNAVCGASRSSSSATAEQGGSFIYAYNLYMPSDDWQSRQTDYDSSGYSITESSILEGGASSGNLYGSTHVFLTGTSSVWDAQAGGRRGSTYADFAYMEISGKAQVRHIACGTITDGNFGSGDRNCVNGTQMVTLDECKVAMLLGAGYDTYYYPTYKSMIEGTINVEIKGGTVGYVYGGGYRGSVGASVKSGVTINIEVSGGTVVKDVFGGGRGGVDKVLHNTGGSISDYANSYYSMGKSEVYGKINVTVSGGTINGNVYGGGESVPKLSSVGGYYYRFDDGNKGVAAVYGNIEIDVKGGTINGDVYGGGKGILASNLTEDRTKSYVLTKAGEFTEIKWFEWTSSPVYDKDYGYLDFAQITGSITLTISDNGTVKGNVYGGGAYGQVSGSTTVTVSGTVGTESGGGNVYGGGQGTETTTDVGKVTDDTDVSISGTVYANVYGGGAYGQVSGATKVAITGAESKIAYVCGSVYGAGQGSLSGVSGIGAVGQVSSVTIDSYSEIKSSVYGGGAYGNVGSSTKLLPVAISLNATVTGNVYGGGSGDGTKSGYGDIGGPARVDVSGIVEGNVYGGGAFGVVNGTTSVSVTGTVGGDVYGGGYGTKGEISNQGATVTVTGGKVVGSVYGGACNGISNGDTSVTLEKSATVGKTVYGGGLGCVGVPSVTGTSKVSVTSSNIKGSVYGGAENGFVTSSQVTLTSGTVNGDVYGAGLGAASKYSVTNNVTVTMSGGTVKGIVYGGAAYGLVQGEITVTLSGGTVEGTVYAGGKGTSGAVSVNGNRKIHLYGAKINGSLYGGSALGTDAKENQDEKDSNAYVYLESGYVKGSVFGGGFQGTTYGATYIYIGSLPSDNKGGLSSKAINGENVINIGESVYLGGDAGTVGSDYKAYKETMVYNTDPCIMNIDGTANSGVKYAMIIGGSLMGSGNSCLTAGKTVINITGFKPASGIESIHRATEVTVDSSEIAMSGRATVDTEISDYVMDSTYSLYKIDKLVLRNGSTLKLSATAENIGEYRSQNANGDETQKYTPLNKIVVGSGKTLSFRTVSPGGTDFGYAEDAEGNIEKISAGSTEYSTFAVKYYNNGSWTDVSGKPDATYTFAVVLGGSEIPDGTTPESCTISDEWTYRFCVVCGDNVRWIGTKYSGTDYTEALKDALNGIIYSPVYGYTIISLNGEDGTDFGGYILGSTESTGGFSVYHEGSFRIADYADIDEKSKARCWYITGTILQEVTVTVNGTDSAQAIVNLPKFQSDTVYRYTGGTFITGAPIEGYVMDKSSPASEKNHFTVRFGYSDGRSDIVTFNGNGGAYLIDFTEGAECIEADENTGATRNPAMLVEVKGVFSGSKYVGYVMIYVNECIKLENGNYVVVNSIQTKMNIYTAASGDTGEVDISLGTVKGTGTGQLLIESGHPGYEVSVISVSPKNENSTNVAKLYLESSKNTDSTLGWTDSKGALPFYVNGIIKTGTIGTLQGGYMSTLLFTVNEFGGTSEEVYDVELQMSNGTDTFTRTVHVHIEAVADVQITFNGIRQYEDSQKYTTLNLTYPFSYGSVISEEDCPPGGDNFVGWYTDENFANPFSYSTPLTRNLNLYALYQYTVTFDHLDGTYSTMHVDMNSPIGNMPTPTREGYTFEGWYADAGYNDKWNEKRTVTGDMTLYAYWVGLDVTVDFGYYENDTRTQIGVSVSTTISFGDKFDTISKALNEAETKAKNQDRFIYWVYDKQWAQKTDKTYAVYSSSYLDDWSMVSEINGKYTVLLDANLSDAAIKIKMGSTEEGDLNATIDPPDEFLVFPETGTTYTFNIQLNDATRPGYNLKGWKLSDSTGKILNDYLFLTGGTIVIEISKVSYDSDHPYTAKFIIGNDEKASVGLTKSEYEKITDGDDPYAFYFMWVWEYIPYTVTIADMENGTIYASYTDSNGDLVYFKTATMHYGETFDLVYQANDGYMFSKWKATGEGKFGNANKLSTVYTVQGDSVISAYAIGPQVVTLTVEVESTVDLTDTSNKSKIPTISLSKDGKTASTTLSVQKTDKKSDTTYLVSYSGIANLGSYTLLIEESGELRSMRIDVESTTSANRYYILSETYQSGADYKPQDVSHVYTGKILRIENSILGETSAILSLTEFLLQYKDSNGKSVMDEKSIDMCLKSGYYSYYNKDGSVVPDVDGKDVATTDSDKSFTLGSDVSAAKELSGSIIQQKHKISVVYDEDKSTTLDVEVGYGELYWNALSTFDITKILGYEDYSVTEWRLYADDGKYENINSLTVCKLGGVNVIIINAIIVKNDEDNKITFEIEQQGKEGSGYTKVDTKITYAKGEFTYQLPVYEGFDCKKIIVDSWIKSTDGTVFAVVFSGTVPGAVPGSYTVSEDLKYKFYLQLSDGTNTYAGWIGYTPESDEDMSFIDAFKAALDKKGMTYEISGDSISSITVNGTTYRGSFDLYAVETSEITLSADGLITSDKWNPSAGTYSVKYNRSTVTIDIKEICEDKTEKTIGTSTLRYESVLDLSEIDLDSDKTYGSWTVGKGLSGKIVDNVYTVTLSDVISEHASNPSIYVNSFEPRYTVTFITHNGKIKDSATSESGEVFSVKVKNNAHVTLSDGTITLTDADNKEHSFAVDTETKVEGYSFSGWSITGNINITSDTKITALWAAETYAVNVYYNTDNVNDTSATDKSTADNVTARVGENVAELTTISGTTKTIDKTTYTYLNGKQMTGAGYSTMLYVAIQFKEKYTLDADALSKTNSGAVPVTGSDLRHYTIQLRVSDATVDKWTYKFYLQLSDGTNIYAGWIGYTPESDEDMSFIDAFKFALGKEGMTYVVGDDGSISSITVNGITYSGTFSAFYSDGADWKDYSSGSYTTYAIRNDKSDLKAKVTDAPAGSVDIYLTSMYNGIKVVWTIQYADGSSTTVDNTESPEIGVVYTRNADNINDLAKCMLLSSYYFDGWYYNGSAVDIVVYGSEWKYTMRVPNKIVNLVAYAYPVEVSGIDEIFESGKTYDATVKVPASEYAGTTVTWNMSYHEKDKTDTKTVSGSSSDTAQTICSFDKLTDVTYVYDLTITKTYGSDGKVYTYTFKFDNGEFEVHIRQSTVYLVVSNSFATPKDWKIEDHEQYTVIGSFVPEIDKDKWAIDPAIPASGIAYGVYTLTPTYSLVYNNVLITNDHSATYSDKVVYIYNSSTAKWKILDKEGDTFDNTDDSVEKPPVEVILKSGFVTVNKTGYSSIIA